MHIISAQHYVCSLALVCKASHGHNCELIRQHTLALNKPLSNMMCLLTTVEVQGERFYQVFSSFFLLMRSVFKIINWLVYFTLCYSYAILFEY